MKKEADPQDLFSFDSCRSFCGGISIKQVAQQALNENGQDAIDGKKQEPQSRSGSGKEAL